MEELNKAFEELFIKNGYSSHEYFDFSIWFMKNEYLEDILTETPTEDTDIIKFLLIKSYSRSKHKHFKILVNDFIEEIADILKNLHKEKKRVENLISLYDAYDTKNAIEQNLLNFERLMKNQEVMKTKMQISVNGIDRIPKGEYKFTLMATYINHNEKYKNLQEQVYEYKMNHILRNIDESKSIKFQEKEYFFPKLEFYSFEVANFDEKMDSGTNLLYFVIKTENLSKSYDDIGLSEKKPLLDIFLSNIKNILKNKMTTTLESQCLVSSRNYNFTINININVELDPWTLCSIYTKIFRLLQSMISYKVLIDHKIKTILNYFPEIKPIHSDIFDRKEEKKSDCLII